MRLSKTAWSTFVNEEHIAVGRGAVTTGDELNVDDHRLGGDSDGVPLPHVQLPSTDTADS